MARVRIENAGKSYGATRVIEDVSLDVEDGEFLVLVGPSGCGKSTLLRMIAGLEELSAGRIHIGARDVSDVVPKDRNVAMVFQSYALYPNKTVRENIAFPLLMHGAPRAPARQRVEEAAAILGLGPLLDRKPRQLSGGQRQRVAMGRSIVRDPDVFLFDEPLSNLDAKLRVEMRSEIKALHRRLGATIVYVTHDQTEAMTMGDRIVVLDGGRIEQVGTPAELYGRPAGTFVAEFIGSPKMNLLRGPVAEARGAAVIGIRPEHLDLSDEAGEWRGSVIEREYLGSDTYLRIHAEGPGELLVRADGAFAAREGDTVFATPRPGALHRFDAEGRALRPLEAAHG